MNDPVTTAIIIPARNEADRIGECLTALAAQKEPGIGILVVANNCTDDTAARARACAAAVGLRLRVEVCTLDAMQGVGAARGLGVAAALRDWPGVEQILTTDADARVAAGWIARSRAHLLTADAVCGAVVPMAAELGVLDGMDLIPAQMEGRYEALVQAFYRRMRPDGMLGDHGHAAGASLGLRTAAYRAVGGFAPVASGEDRDLVRRLKLAGLTVVHAGDVQVAASCRLDGRAPDGMAAALRARSDRTDYLIDDALPPARWLIAAAARGDLGPWPLQVAPQDRLHARDLAPQIALLQQALAAPVDGLA